MTVPTSNDVSLHYKKHYVNLKKGKSLISFLAGLHYNKSGCLETFQKQHTIPNSLQQRIDTALQSILVGHSTSFLDDLLNVLVPQVVFRDFLSQELHKINTFSLTTFEKLESQMILIFRSLKNLENKLKERYDNASKYHPHVPTCQSPYDQKQQDQPGLQENTLLLVIPKNSQNVFEGVTCTVQAPFTTYLQSLRSQDNRSNENVNTGDSFKERILFDLWVTEELQRYEYELKCCEAEIIHLDMFIRINYKSCIELCHFFDKEINSTIANWVAGSLRREAFTNVSLDRLLIFMSVVWDKYRTLNASSFQVSSMDDNSAWVPPDTFHRNTTKYWVKLDQVVRTKLLILRHVPYLIFGATKKELENYFNPFSSSHSQQVSQKNNALTECSKKNVHLPLKKKDSLSHASNPVYLAARKNPIIFKEGQLVTSVYFDSTEGYCYKQRITRQEGSELIRFRWYGSNNGESSKPIYVERKTHHESWTGDLSTKERFTMNQQYIHEYILNRLTFSNYIKKNTDLNRISEKKLKNMIHLADSIQESIQKHHLQPMLRTSYQRAAFQSSTSNDIRFSLDTNLCMVQEYISEHVTTPNSKNNAWCRWGEEIHGQDAVIRIPYAILEVKLQVTDQPSWVSSILASTDAIMVYKFSKYQHGMIFLYPEFVSQHGIPHWFHTYCSMTNVPFRTSSLTKETCEKTMSNPYESGANFETIKPLEGYVILFFKRILNRFSHYAQNSLVAMKLYFLKDLTDEKNSIIINDYSYCTLSIEKNQFLNREKQHRNSFSNDTTLVNTESISRSLNHPLEQRQSANSKATSIFHETYCWNLNLYQRFKDCSLAELNDMIMKKSLNVPLIDPKSYFAAERSFLHYIEKTYYLAALMFLFLHSNNILLRYIGIYIFWVIITVLLFSHSLFHYRCNEIQRRITKYSCMKNDYLTFSYPFGVKMVSSIVISCVLLGFFSGLVLHENIFQKNFIKLI